MPTGHCATHHPRTGGDRHSHTRIRKSLRALGLMRERRAVDAACRQVYDRVDDLYEDWCPDISTHTFTTAEFDALRTSLPHHRPLRTCGQPEGDRIVGARPGAHVGVLVDDGRQALRGRCRCGFRHRWFGGCRDRGCVLA